MTPLIVEAVYEKGVLKPSQPLPLANHQRVTVTVDTGLSPVQQTAGLIPCSDPELIDHIALDPLEDL